MEPDETYMHLDTENSQMKDKLVKEYYHQVRQILKIELNSKTKSTDVNTLLYQSYFTASE